MNDQGASIWVDADACPRVVREILFRASNRTGTPTILVANQSVQVPPSRFIRSIQVAPGFDVANNYIAQNARPGDLVITADIPLAADVIKRSCTALNPRGELYTRETIGQKLNMRDFMDSMRASGIHTGGQAAFSQSDKQAFANQLDRWLANR